MTLSIVKRFGWCSAAVLGAAVFTVSSAQAHDEWKHWKKHGYFVPPGHVYYARPVVYAPRPVVVYEQPVYYAPAPAYYGPPPGLNLNFNIPLR